MPQIPDYTTVTCTSSDLFVIEQSGVTRNTTMANIDSYLFDRAAVFNNSGADVDFRIESDTEEYAFFIEGSNGFVSMGAASPGHRLDLTGTTIPGGEDPDVEDPTLRLTNDADDNLGAKIIGFNDTSTPSDNDDCLVLSGFGRDSGNNETEFAKITLGASDVSSGTERGEINFELIEGSTWRTFLRMSNNISGAQRIHFNTGGQDVDYVLETNVEEYGFYLVGSSGCAYLGDSTNADMTKGLTINQAANDDEVIAFKSTDIIHGLTSYAETDTYASERKANAGFGGLQQRVIGETSAFAPVYQVNVFGGGGNTTKTTSGEANIQFYSTEHDGANALSNLTADSNVFAVRGRVGAADRTLFLVDEDGDFYYDGTDAGAMDIHDDAAIVRAIDLHASRNVVKMAFDDYAKKYESQLVELGILGDTVENGGLVNGAQLLRVHNGAIGQTRAAMEVIVSTLADMLGEEFASKFLTKLEEAGLKQITMNT